MSIGLFQNLPGAHEMGGADTLANEPWLLPISDSHPVKDPLSAEAITQAVRNAARPFWMAANGLGVALALALTLVCTTGWMSSAPHISGPVAEASPPTIAVEKAAFTAQH